MLTPQIQETKIVAIEQCVEGCTPGSLILGKDWRAESNTRFPTVLNGERTHRFRKRKLELSGDGSSPHWVLSKGSPWGDVVFTVSVVSSQLLVFGLWSSDFDSLSEPQRHPDPTLTKKLKDQSPKTQDQQLTTDH